MRAVTFLLAFSVAGCTFRISGIDRGTSDAGIFRLEGGATPAPDDLASPAADLTPPVTTPPPPPPADLAAAPPDLASGLLEVTSALPGAMVDLTKEGAYDWAHWGYVLAGDYDHKANGGGQISNYVLTGGVPLQYGDNKVAYKWNDGSGGVGQHANSMGPSTTGVYVGGKDNGFKITLPADGTLRHVRLYVGGYQATGQLQATLSDGKSFEDHQYGSTNAEFNVVYDIKYAAGSASQTLTLQWTMYGGASNVTLQAATLLP